MARQIFQELEIHSTLEEDIFYNAVRDQVQPQDLALIDADEEQEEEDDGEGEEESSEEMGEGVIAVAFAEHQVVNALIQELKHMGQGDQFREKFAELKDDVLDHVAAEEDVIFPAVLLKLDVVGLAAQMQKRKRDLMSEAAGK